MKNCGTETMQDEWILLVSVYVIYQGTMTDLKRAVSLCLYASGVFSRGNVSTMHRILWALTKAMQSSISFGVPLGIPRIEKRWRTSDTTKGAVSAHAIHADTETGMHVLDEMLNCLSSTVSNRSVPSTANPGMSFGCISGAFAVHTMTFAPPSFCSSSTWLTFELSKYASAPRLRASSSFSGPEDSATGRYPIARAIWSARCPRPLTRENKPRGYEDRWGAGLSGLETYPIPWIATISPAAMLTLRSASGIQWFGLSISKTQENGKIVLKTVAPAHIRGAISVGSMSRGTAATASVRTVTYSA